jgi:hypothetical protein
MAAVKDSVTWIAICGFDSPGPTKRLALTVSEFSSVIYKILAAVKKSVP